MAKKVVKLVSDKLVKVNENFTVNMYDNGFMLDVGGRDADDNWANAKIMVSNVDELVNLIKDVLAIERAE